MRNIWLNTIDRHLFLFILVTLAAIAVAVSLLPTDIVLGAKIRMILLHGAWVWTALCLFLLASFIAVGWWLMKHQSLCRAAVAVALTGLIFWLLYLPQSLYVMKANWGGFYFSEPRWQIPFAFAIIGLILSAGLYLLRDPRLITAAIVLYSGALFYNLYHIGSVLHPESPVSQSPSIGIKIHFLVLCLLILVLGGLVSRVIYKRLPLVA